MALGAVLFAPTPVSRFEPDWLRAIEPIREEKTTYSGAAGTQLATGYAFSGREWLLDEPISDIRLRLLESLPSSNGWKYETKGDNYEAWSRVGPSADHVKITMGHRNGSVAISSSSMRTITWLERTRLSILRILGFEK